MRGYHLFEGGLVGAAETIRDGAQHFAREERFLVEQRVEGGLPQYEAVEGS